MSLIQQHAPKLGGGGEGAHTTLSSTQDGNFVGQGTYNSLFTSLVVLNFYVECWTDLFFSVPNTVTRR